MRLFRARLWVVAAGLATACGGQSRGPETGQSGASGETGSDACASGKEAYQQKRAQVLRTVASNGCTTDADCGTLWETNACVSTCGVAAPAAGIDAAAQELNAFAKGSCSSCAPIPVPPCTPPRPIKCIQGQCSEGS
jgi:hypothetical protein